MAEKNTIIVQDGNIMIPKTWNMEDYRKFASETDSYFEEDFDSLPCWVWTQICISGTGMIIDISVMDEGQQPLGSICIYEEEQSNNEEYYVFNGYDLFPEDGNSSDDAMDYLSDIAKAFYEWADRNN